MIVYVEAVSCSFVDFVVVQLVTCCCVLLKYLSGQYKFLIEVLLFLFGSYPSDTILRIDSIL